MSRLFCGFAFNPSQGILCANLVNASRFERIRPIVLSVNHSRFQTNISGSRSRSSNSCSSSNISSKSSSSSSSRAVVVVILVGSCCGSGSGGGGGSSRKRSINEVTFKLNHRHEAKVLKS